MGDILSIRLDEKTQGLIEKYLNEHDVEKSEGVRSLIMNGMLFSVIKDYLSGAVSLAKAASLMDYSLSDFMDLLSEIGIKSNVELSDILDGYENLVNLKK